MIDNPTAIHTAQCERQQEQQEDAIARQTWLAEHECGYPECHRTDDVHVCRALGCIALRCPEHMADFRGKWVCEACLAQLEEFVQWLYGPITTPAPLRGLAILTYWSYGQAARNHVTGCAEPEKGEVNREYIPAQ